MMSEPRMWSTEPDVRNADGSITVGVTSTAPHGWQRFRGWRWWLCTHCYAPRSLHPRTGWVRSRPVGDTEYLSKHAPHFNEDW